MALKLGLVWLLGPSPAAVVVFELLLSLGSLITHTDIALPPRLDRRLRWLFVTPSMHRIHHSIWRDETDSNFGFHLSVWDRAFGSYRAAPVRPEAIMPVGLPSFREPTQQSLVALLLQPFRKPPAAVHREARPMHDTWPLLRESDFPEIERERIETLQLNLGYLCNLSCIHCHVDAGPRRKELMDRDTMALALQVAERRGIGIFDLTGGSPEMNPALPLAGDAGARARHPRHGPAESDHHGRAWLRMGRRLSGRASCRSLASLPCYSQANVDEQRGEGVFEASIRALARSMRWATAKPAAAWC